ncbi:hypothetical protein [Hydrogenophaga sp. ZJX-1]|uniref:hypothetical protein n=1 Tax=Hydrogenophaga sp. ZJX-1 TaxID=3404778 RepID=UPI003B27B88F
MHPPGNEARDPDEDGVHLPSVEALTAGTLALMTGYAQAPADCPNRSLMARKLVSNLFFLSGHPQVSPPMRTLLANLRTRWQPAAEAAPMAGPDRQPSPLWHTAPVRVQ